MKFIENEKYKVTCILEKSELYCYGLSLDDILNRSPGVWGFLHELKAKVISMTGYEWPGCAYSSEIKAISDQSLAITFSETIDDFVYNLKQSVSLSNGNTDGLNKLILEIENSDEKAARSIIKRFEANVKELM